MTLPSIGQLAWGGVLNADIQSDETTLSTVQTGLNNHLLNLPPDPHGDRAYTLSLITPITTGVNQPNGYVVLDGSGHIPLNLVPVGAGLTNWIDVIPDYNVPTNGVSDASAAINAALNQTNVNGGGIVYVGSGHFALANPLLIYPNTWLLCSPGAVFTRLNLITPPFAMIQNWSSGIAPTGSNIRVSGGQWNIASLSNTGVFFQFVNAGFVLIEDLSVTAYADGLSSIGELYGCPDVTLDNVQISAGPPINAGRHNQHHPCFRVEECNPVNIPGVPNSVYLNQICTDIRIRGCKLRAGTFTDGQGAYSAWTSFCGSIGTIVSGSLHQNINIVEGNFCSGLAVAAVEVLNWSNLTCTGNFFTFPASAYVTTWNGCTAQLTTFIFDINCPRCYPPTTTGPCSNTLVETIITQFTIPINDWLPGTSCYRHRHTGTLRCATSSETLTIKVYVGPLGTTGDTLVETITVNFSSAVVNVPYACEREGFSIDPDGHWTPLGIRFRSSAITVTEVISISAIRFIPTPGTPLFVTHTCTWSAAKPNNQLTCLSGVHERINL